MVAKRNRALDGLGDPAYTEQAFQAIERAFNPLWLETEGDHPIKKLWNRSDRLATVELFVFGAALEKLQRTHPEWLRKTLKKVKTNKPYIGFITEIITCAQLEVTMGTLEPADMNQSGYDLVAHYEHGAKHFISIKNHDVSDAQKEFNQHSKQVRNLWRQKLTLDKQNLAMRVIGHKPMSKEDFEHIKSYIRNDIDMRNRAAVNIGEGMTVIIASLHRSVSSLSRNHTSDIFLAMAPAPISEQLRFIRSVVAAAANMKKNILGHAKACNVIFMRVHINADLESLVAAAQETVNDHDNGVDCVLFYQPSYARDSKNASLISNTFKAAVSMRYVHSLDGRPAFTLRAALGTVSIETPRLVVQSNGNVSQRLPPNTFLFQQGDIYIAGETPGEGNMSSPAAGIREHAVLEFQGQELTFTGKIFPLSDDLLIV